MDLYEQSKLFMLNKKTQMLIVDEGNYLCSHCNWLGRVGGGLEYWW